MPIDDDEYYAYEDASGDEGQNSDYDFQQDLSPTDEVELFKLLPTVKNKLKSYNDTISDLAIKEALWYNYLEIEPTLKELKSKFPKKAAAIPPQDESKSISNSGESPAPKISKLAALAKSRANKSLGGITGSVAQSTTPSIKPSSLDILNNLSTKLSNTSTRPASIGKLTLKSGSGKLLLRKKKDISIELVSETSKIQNNLPKEPEPMEIESPPIQPASQLDLNVVYDEEHLLPKPISNMSQLLSEDAPPTANKKRKLPEIFSIFIPSETNPNIVKKIKKNFNDPSPDDLIINSQHQAFNDKLSNLKIKEEPVKPVKSTAKKIDLEKEITSLKPHKSFVVMGHVDAGKSTLMGRVLYDIGKIDNRTLTKLMSESDKIGKGSFALAWIMDQTSEERSRGVTVDICCTDFETPSTNFTIIDAPGHKDFVPQLISGITQADFALLVVDASSNNFESGFHFNGQTREHILLAKSLGIENLIVGVNKLDLNGWDQERFIDIKLQLEEYLVNEVGFDKKLVSYIPISGLNGDNVIKKSNDDKLTKWYKGVTLIEELESVKLASSSIESENIAKEKEKFNLSINDIYYHNKNVMVRGKINSGIIQPGDSLLICPANKVVKVNSIFNNDEDTTKPIPLGITNDNIILGLKSFSFEDEDVQVGDLITSTSNPLKSYTKFEASLNLFKLERPLLIGTPFVLFRNNLTVPARISKVIKLVNSDSKRKLRHLSSNQNALVEIEIDGRSLPLTLFKENTSFGRVVLRKDGMTIGAGVVEKLVE